VSGNLAFRGALVSWWQGAILGLIQGITEFLPVSSSGHLALAQRLIPGFRQPGVAVDLMLHVGTALAVVWAERRAIARWMRGREGAELLGLLVVGTAVTGAVGVALEGPATAAFGSPLAVGTFLILTGVVVLGTRWLPGGARSVTNTGAGRAALIGLVQGLAVFPGISRSGTTIAAGLAAGLDRAWAARFSFLLSVPAIAGATVLELARHGRELAATGPELLGPALLGAAVAAVTGFLALRLVVRTVSSRVFDRFGLYCLPLGAVVVLLALGGVL